MVDMPTPQLYDIFALFIIKLFLFKNLYKKKFFSHSMPTNSAYHPTRTVAGFWLTCPQIPSGVVLQHYLKHLRGWVQWRIYCFLFGDFMVTFTSF